MLPPGGWTHSTGHSLPWLPLPWRGNPQPAAAGGLHGGAFSASCHPCRCCASHLPGRRASCCACRSPEGFQHWLTWPALCEPPAPSCLFCGQDGALTAPRGWVGWPCSRKARARLALPAGVEAGWSPQSPQEPQDGAGEGWAWQQALPPLPVPCQRALQQGWPPCSPCSLASPSSHHPLLASSPILPALSQLLQEDSE